MRITRREFCVDTAKLVVVGTVLAGGASGLGLIAPALAQTPSLEELMVPGPLGEKVQGDANAPVTLIEYAAVTCSHCANFYKTVYPTLKSRYIDTGKVRFIFREFPLYDLDIVGFMLARCVGDDKYFTFIDVLFERQRDWAFVRPAQAKTALLAIAKQAGLSQEAFDACLANRQIEDGVRWGGSRAAEKFGVNSTPTFFINGKPFRGELTAEELEKQLEPYLKS